MSSLRPARIVATLLRLIDGSLAGIDEPDSPPCGCSSCEEAWHRNRLAKSRLVPASAHSRGRRGFGLG